MLDDDLLRRLSESDEVRDRGRSEVVRRAVDLYLTQRERERIAEQYRSAYSQTNALEDELDGWTGEAEWPNG